MTKAIDMLIRKVRISGHYHCCLLGPDGDEPLMGFKRLTHSARTFFIAAEGACDADETQGIDLSR